MFEFDGLYYRISKKIKERDDLIRLWLGQDLARTSEKFSVLDFEFVVLVLLFIIIKNKTK